MMCGRMSVMCGGKGDVCKDEGDVWRGIMSGRVSGMV